MKAEQRAGASPGGPIVSAAKRRRLAALDDAILGPGRQQKHAAVNPIAKSASQPSLAAVQGRGGAVAATAPTGAEFPYNPLEDSVLDGSLSAALAQAKAAAAAAAAAVEATASNTTAGTRRSRTLGASSAISASSAAAAAAAAAGGDSVAAEVLAQLVTTNPRASGSDLRSLLTQRLQDRSVLLDNPLATLKAKKLFARRTSSYSSKLRSNAQRKATLALVAQGARQTPSYQTMLKVHELWLRYTEGLVQTAAAGAKRGGLAAGGAGGAGGSGSGVEALGRLVDVHGAMVTVVQHANPQLVGATGIVMRRSSSCLHLVEQGDRVRVVPLKGCIAQYSVNGTTFQLSG